MLQIKSVNHKGLKALMTTDNPAKVKGLSAHEAVKIHQQMTVLESSTGIRSVASSFPGWKVHELTPKWPGKWSMWVTGNYRLTFRLDQVTGEITDLNYEDYH